MEVYRLLWGELTSLQHRACPSGDEHIHGVMSAARTAGLGAESDALSGGGRWQFSWEGLS